MAGPEAWLTLAMYVWVCVSVRGCIYSRSSGAGSAMDRGCKKSKRTAGHRLVVGTKIAGDCSVHSPGAGSAG
jgi:hypothetical protein